VARLAVIGGHSILGGERALGLAERQVETAHGAVAVLEGEDFVFLQRHGLGAYRTAARIEHRANLAALAELGCDRIMALGSVGGLKSELGVGTFLCPDDFIALQLGLSLSDGHEGERVPGFDPEWRARVLGAWRGAGVDVFDGGIYWQAIGPRFETPAEIRLIAAHADVIGMTIAAECILAGELGLAYAAVCIVDNLANGIGPTQLTVEEFEAGKAANRERLVAALGPVVAALGEEG
jgi:5'-methylthioadenosine phosphorylase